VLAKLNNRIESVIEFEVRATKALVRDFKSRHSLENDVRVLVGITTASLADFAVNLVRTRRERILLRWLSFERGLKSVDSRLLADDGSLPAKRLRLWSRWWDDGNQLLASSSGAGELVREGDLKGGALWGGLWRDGDSFHDSGGVGGGRARVQLHAEPDWIWVSVLQEFVKEFNSFILAQHEADLSHPGLWQFTTNGGAATTDASLANNLNQSRNGLVHEVNANLTLDLASRLERVFGTDLNKFLAHRGHSSNSAQMWLASEHIRVLSQRN